VIRNLNAFAGTYLELPLSRHRLAICACDFDARIEASSVVSLHNSSPKAVVSSYRTIVGALRARISTRRPAERLGGKFVLGLKD
jgi:hypothetical protein